MQEVQVLEATRTAPNSRGRVRSNPITVERIRVAAYVSYVLSFKSSPILQKCRRIGLFSKKLVT